MFHAAFDMPPWVDTPEYDTDRFVNSLVDDAEANNYPLMQLLRDERGKLIPLIQQMPKLLCRYFDVLSNYVMTERQDIQDPENA